MHRKSKKAAPLEPQQLVELVQLVERPMALPPMALPAPAWPAVAGEAGKVALAPAFKSY